MLCWHNIHNLHRQAASSAIFALIATFVLNQTFQRNRSYPYIKILSYFMAFYMFEGSVMLTIFLRTKET